MATAGTWRKHPFVSGLKYRVLKDYRYLNSEFVAGAEVEFESAGYERYDSMSLFRFYVRQPSFAMREELIWNLHDEEPDSKMLEYFGPVEAAS